MKLLFLSMLCVLAALVVPAAAGEGVAGTPTTHPSRFGDGDGPSLEDGVYRLLDSARSPNQSNAVAFDRSREGGYEVVSLRCMLRVLEGGDGGGGARRDVSVRCADLALADRDPGQ